MNIILLKDVDNLGYENDVVTVKPGYARNFLIPQGFAVVANSKNSAILEKKIEEIKAKEEARLDEYKAFAAKLDGAVVKIVAKAGTTGKIFGSVTNVQVTQALKDQFNVDVERKKVVLLEIPKELGTYGAELRFHPLAITKISFEVIEG